MDTFGTTLLLEDGGKLSVHDEIFLVIVWSGIYFGIIGLTLLIVFFIRSVELFLRLKKISKYAFDFGPNLHKRWLLLLLLLLTKLRLFSFLIFCSQIIINFLHPPRCNQHIFTRFHQQTQMQLLMFVHSWCLQLLTCWQLTGHITQIIIYFVATRRSTSWEVISHLYYSVVWVCFEMHELYSSCSSFVAGSLGCRLCILGMKSLLFTLAWLKHFSVLNVFLFDSIAVDISDLWFFFCLEFFYYFTEFSMF